jgi:hypothetical protein
MSLEKAGLWGTFAGWPATTFDRRPTSNNADGRLFKKKRGGYICIKKKQNDTLTCQPAPPTQKKVGKSILIFADFVLDFCVRLLALIILTTYKPIYTFFC